jgi:GT2 family glycosyltransferase
MKETLLIIPSYISKPYHVSILAQCVFSIKRTTDYPLLIVDDGSPGDFPNQAYDALLKRWPDIEVHRKEENEGFSKTVNIGLAKALAEGKDACLINADIEFKEKDWLKEFHESEADVVGALLLYPNLLIQHAGIYFSALTRTFNHRFVGAPPDLPTALKPKECPVTGALQYISHNVLADIGIYDEKFQMGFEDVDFMIRAIQAGYKSLYNPKIKAIHHESLFRKEKSEKVKLWERKSLVYLMTKYQGVNFEGIAPTHPE